MQILKKNKISDRLSKLLLEEPKQGKDKLIQNKHKKIIKIKSMKQRVGSLRGSAKLTNF